MTTTLDTLQIPLKAYYVLGTNWYCYVEATPDDRETLTPEDLVIQLCTYAVEAYFGLRDNDTLTVMDAEKDPMIGVVLGICDKGDEQNDDLYVYVPSFKVLGNTARFLDSATAQVEYEIFHKELEEKRKLSAALPVKRHANSKPRFPVRYPASPNAKPPVTPPPSGENPS